MPWVICLWLTSFSLLADGGFVTPTALAQVRIPDQRALICYANGVETLVIDTAFKGDGTNFAWIIPVPSRPEVQAATTGLFPTLERLFRPKVIHNIPHIWIGVLVAAIFLYAIIRRTRRAESLLDVLLVILILVILSGLFLPALATAGATTTNITDEVTVLDRKIVGGYETAVLASSDGAALQGWLTQNGFGTPTNFLPTIQAYAREGWYFVASRLRLDATMQTSAKPHPLILTFKPERPVYPLRLTSIGNATTEFDLFVFGPGRAALPHFKVKTCAQPDYTASSPGGYGKGGSADLRIQHPLLRQLVDGSAVATHLSGRLTAAQMREDAYVSWEPFTPKHQTFFSRQGAGWLVFNICACLLSLAWVLWAFCVENEKTWGRKLHQGTLRLALITVAGALPMYLALPKISVTVSTMPFHRVARLYNFRISRSLAYEAHKAATNQPAFQPNAAWVRTQLAPGAPLWKQLSGKMENNLFTGQTWREQDSPGNWTVHETPSGVELRWYDVNGAPQPISLSF
jgi:hypothetical protein